MRVRCIKTYKIGSYTFNEGSEYRCGRINEKYWVVEAVGVEHEAMKEYFQIIDDK